MNKLIIMGRLTADPETRYSQDGKAIVNFSVAVDRYPKREGYPDADFFRCTCFGKTAENAGRQLFKGIKILIEGEIHNADYTDKNGVKHYSMGVNVARYEFCEPRRDAQPQAAPAPQYQAQYQAAPQYQAPAQPQAAPQPQYQQQSLDGFMNVGDSELPWN